MIIYTLKQHGLGVLRSGSMMSHRVLLVLVLYTVNFNGNDLISGVYYVQFMAQSNQWPSVWYNVADNIILLTFSRTHSQSKFNSCKKVSGLKPKRIIFYRFCFQIKNEEVDWLSGQQVVCYAKGHEGEANTVLRQREGHGFTISLKFLISDIS